MVLTNIESIPNKTIIKYHGIVAGSTVRTKHTGRDIMAGFKNFFGGELTGDTALLSALHEEVMARMRRQAQSLGANAIVNVRFSTHWVAAELYVYGTAVTVA